MWLNPDVSNKMAAPCRKFTRSAIEAGLQFLSNGNLGYMTACVQSSRPQWCVLHHRVVHNSSFSLLHITNKTAARTNHQEKEGEADREEDSGPEYVPKRKAKNPMKVVGYAWIIGLPAGIIGFIVAKRQVDRNRLQQLKIRQRMKKSNEGEYEHERYRLAEELKTERVGIKTV